MLATSESKLRYFEEPLFHLKPELHFTDTYDHTALNYQPSSSQLTRLIWAYKIFTAADSDWEKMGVKNALKRNDPEFEACLIKEVHGLLAVEQLITAVPCPAVFIIRNPLYIVDSIINAQSLNTAYLEEEAKKIPSNLAFLTKYFPKNSDNIITTYEKIEKISISRKRIILRKILTAAIITEYFKKLSNKSPNVLLVHYENICLQPSKEYKNISNFFGIIWDQKSENKLKKTTSRNSNPDDPYSISRITSKQVNKKLKVLTDEEKKEAEEILHKCGLSYTYSSGECRTPILA